MNPFDDALDDVIEQSPAPIADQAAPDPFGAAVDAVIGEDVAARTARIRVAGDRADAIDPARAADVYRLARQYGLPASHVERNFDTIQRRARHDNTPYARMLRETPALADYLSDPIQAAAVKEDVEPLAILENTVRVTANSLRSLLSAFPRSNAALWGVIESGAELAGASTIAATAKEFRRQGMLDAEFLKGPQTGAGDVEKAFYAGWESLGLMVPGALMSIATGTPGPMLTFMGATTGGESYGRARDTGINPTRANLFALTQGGIEVATEMIPANWFLKDLAANATFRRMVLHQLGSEIPGEQIATALQDLDEWATLNPSAPFSTYLAQRPEAFVHTLIATITTVGAMTTVTGALQRYAGDNGRAERATESKGFFDAIAQAVGSMKSAEKHPASIETVIAQAASGTPIENLYAPLDTFTNYWQSVGDDPAARAAELTGDPDAYANALRTGQDLAIPTAAYAARLANTDHHAYFVNELRLAPDEMNIREATAFKEQQAAAVAAEAETAEPSPVAALAAGLRSQLEAAGVEPTVSAQYTDLVESAFTNIAEIALDPQAIFGALGLKVERPGFEAPEAPTETAVPAAAQPRQATIEEASGVSAVQDADAATGLVVAEPREPNIIEPVARETGITDETGRALGGYAGAERRSADVGAPEGVERRRRTDEPLDVSDPVRAAMQMRAENPAVDVEGEAMRQRALAAGRTKEPPELRAQRHGAVLDKKARGEDTTEDVDAGTQLEASRIVDSGRSPAENRVAASRPGSGKAADQRTTKHLEKVFGAVLDSAQQLDPNVDATRLRDEFDFRVAFYLDQQQLAASSDADPHLILRTIAEYGGISLSKDAERGDEIRQMFGGEMPAFGAVGGVRGVFRKPVRATKAGQKSAGWPIDVMLQMLQGDSRFSWLDNVDMLLDQIDEAMRHGADRIDAGVLPGTEELRDVGIRRERTWWADAWRNADMLDDVDEATIEGAVGDTSFDVSEFDQSLFDEFDALEDKGGDVLATGEVQPRLPEAGQVREQEVATPEIAEVPFSLTAPIAKPGKKNAGQKTLFQGDEITVASVQAWAESVRSRAGEDVKAFDVNLTSMGDLSLDSLIVARGAQRAGLGTTLMRELTRFADANGLRVVLTPGARDPIHGTTSRARLVKFYKRFGFVENKGRHKDFRISAGMLREPSVRILDQPLFHGTPHNVDRFSTEKVGTGEGSNSYGWGLYFAENPAVAANYYDQLSENPPIKKLKIGSMVLRPETGFDYSRRAGENTVENVRASLAEDLLINELEMIARKSEIQAHVLEVLDEKIKNYEQEGYPEGVAAGQQLRKELARPGAVAVEYEETTGGVYQIEIDDAKVASMLDWDAALSEQPENVQRALAEIEPTLWGEAIADDDFDASETGEMIYYRLTELYRKENHPHPTRAASLALAEHGVPGLRYFDQHSRDQKQGTRNVVVFDESIIEITHKNGSPITAAERKEFFDERRIGDATERRGSIRFGADRQFTISLLEKADLSTFLHESGHLFLELFGDLADQLRAVDAGTLSPRQAKALADYDALLKWLGVDQRGAIDVEHHEKFARGFEAYLLEGRAPSQELRAAFARFRSWLVGIYRSLKGLRVELTDDVRRIMDRLVASEDAITRAEAEGAVFPMFTTAGDAGMTPEEFELYRDTVAQASQTARETLEVKMLAEVQREQAAAWKSQRQEINDAVRVETYEMPVYQALAAMQRGTKPNGGPLVEGVVTPPIKLSRKLIVDRYGKDRLKRLPRPYVYSKDGGLDPDAAATMFGYTSGDELLKAIENAEPMERRIERETDRRMIEQHGSMLLDGSLQDRAQAAIANEHREDIVRAELRALGKLRRAVSPFVRQARQATAAAKQTEIDALAGEVSGLKAQARGGAARINAALPPANVVRDAAALAVARMRVREIKPSVYWAAARRAGQRALEAAARQDFEAAITAKQHELMSLAVFREASRVLDDVEARVQRALDLGRPSARQRLGKAGGSFLEQVETLLDRYDFVRQSGRAVDRRESLRSWVQALQAQGIPVEIPDDVLDDTRRVHYRELTVEELVGVSDALDHIVHLSRLKNKLLKAAAGRELTQTAEDLARSIRAHFTGERREVIETHLPSEQRKRSVAGFFASHRKLASLARQIDGFEDGGAMWEALLQPINAAGDREAAMNADATRKLTDIVQAAYPGRERVRLYEKTHIPAIGTSLTKMGRLMVALNWGNEDNRQRIRNGYQWNEQQVGAVLDTLDERDWRFVQGVWDFIDGYWTEIAAKQQRVTGVAPAKVEAVPVHTKFGIFNGGYFPLRYNERLEPQASSQLELEAANLAKQAAYVTATTRRGHTKERVKNVKMRVRLDFGVLFEHVTQVVHDLSHHEMLIDVGRVLGHDAVRTAIYETHGELIYHEIKDAVRDIAFGVVPAVRFHEKAINHLRQGATIAGLGWNLTTAALQPLGLTQSIVRVGPKWIGRGLGRWLRDAATMENTVAWIGERSTFMRLRGQTQQREISEIRNQIGVNTGRLSGWMDEALRKTTFDQVSRQGIADSFFFLIQQMQRVADVPTWLGAYEKAMDAGETEDRAVAIADQAVLDAQGGGQVKDLAGIQRGGPLLRLWTNFYSFFNTTYNLTVESTKRTNFKKPGQVGRLAVDYLLLYSVPATLGYLVREALKPGDDDETLAEALIRENLGYLMGTIVGLREVSGSVQGYYGYEGPAGARAFSSAARVVKQVEQGEADAAFWRALNDLAGVLFHYPSGQTRRTIEGVAAIAEGETSNPGALVVGAPR